MAVDDDDVIDHVVVKVHADTSDVAKEATTGIKKEQKKIPTAKVRLVADKTGFVKSAQEELKKVKQTLRYKVALVADADHFLASAKAALAKQALKPNQPEYKIKLVADSVRGGRAGRGGGVDREARKAEAEDKKADRIQWSRFRDREEQLEHLNRLGLLSNLKIARSFEELQAHQYRVARDAAFKEYAAREKAEKAANSASVNDKRRTEQEKTRIAERAAREQERDFERRRKSLKSATQTPTLIDFGGAGFRPMNLLYGAVTALTPALFAMASSAAQASTAVAALGAAGIGASLAISGLVLSFGSVMDALKLSQTVDTEGLVKSAKDAVGGADDMARAQRELANAQRDEKQAYADIHKARQEAIRDLEDLRQAVRDLDNQYKSDRLSVAEAERDERATNANFFATALDRARAHQDTLDARTRFADTALQRKQKRQDLGRSLKQGIEGSDKVRDAREAARDARDRRLDAQSASAKKVATSLGGASSASEQLKRKLAEMSPAARDMFNWFKANDKMLKGLRRTIEQGVLPGFTTFLRAVSKVPRGGKSTLQLAAQYAAQLGGIISKYAGRFGKFTQSPFFREEMATIQENNASALDKMGQAAERLIRPILRIFTAASPLLVKFSDKLIEIADQFDIFIENAQRNGTLQQWFEDAAKQAGNWWQILKNVGTLLRNIFSASLPAGSNLVERFRDFTGDLAKWSSSSAGQQGLAKFFDFFRNINYAQVGQFLIQATELFITMKAVKWIYVNPAFTALGIIATSNPAMATQFMQWLGKLVETVGGVVGAHPEATAFLLALVSLGRLNKAGGGILFKLTGITALTTLLKDKFTILDKFLGGGAKTGVMNVQAGVVNVYGAAGAGGAPGVVGKAGGLAGLVAGLGVAAAIGVLLYAYDQYGKRRAEVATASGREKYTFGNLQGDVRRYGFMPGTGMQANDPKVVQRQFVKDYIDARRKSVAALVEETRKTQGDTAAKALNLAETKKSSDVLSTMLQQYGWTKDKADQYARAVYNLNGLLYNQKVEAYNAKGAVDEHGKAAANAGKKAEEATPKIKILNEELDNVGRVAKVTFETAGKEKVQGDLEDLAAYQQLLRQGKAPTEANLKRQKMVFEKGRASGGLIGGHSPDSRADNIPAMLTANEYVQPVSSVKYYGKDFMEAVRTRRFPRYAAGGQVQVWPFPVKVPPEAGKMEAEAGLGYTPYTGAVPKGVGALKGLTGTMTFAAIDANRATGAHVSSGLRPGAITVTGNRSYHGYGRAVDFVPPSMALFQYLKNKYDGAIRELIYSPAGKNQVWNGKPHMYTGAVRATHWDHVHLAMANGGMVPTRKYDTGGYLPPGYSLAFNGTGKPETVRTSKQESALSGPVRLDRRDLMLLAAHISGASPAITMDGRRVAELTNRYNYLPSGV